MVLQQKLRLAPACDSDNDGVAQPLDLGVSRLKLAGNSMERLIVCCICQCL
jgi:hypothetical protein